MSAQPGAMRATVRGLESTATCPWCHVIIDPRGMAAHRQGLRCLALGTRKQLTSEGWHPVGPLNDAACAAFEKAGIDRVYDYAGTFSDGARGRPGFAPRTHYIKEPWVVAIWRAIAYLSGMRRQTTFVFLVQNEAARAVVQSAVMLGAALDAAFFRHLQTQFPALQAAIDAGRVAGHPEFQAFRAKS